MPRGPYNKVSEETRKRIWATWCDPDRSKSMKDIATAEGIPKGTVQGIINSFRKAAAGIPKKKPGPRSKLTKQCVCC